jgi:glycosyltransferase involved in cell wall biosynthesis
MVRLAAQHDVGLSSELSTPPNRSICLTNKIFTYLLAGIPILLSNTPAQRELAPQLKIAARLVDFNNSDEIVNALNEWLVSAPTLAAAKREAWRLGRTRFNWDLEKEYFLRSVKRGLE